MIPIHPNGFAHLVPCCNALSPSADTRSRAVALKLQMSAGSGLKYRFDTRILEGYGALDTPQSIIVDASDQVKDADPCFSEVECESTGHRVRCLSRSQLCAPILCSPNDAFLIRSQGNVPGYELRIFLVNVPLPAYFMNMDHA